MVHLEAVSDKSRFQHVIDTYGGPAATGQGIMGEFYHPCVVVWLLQWHRSLLV